MIHTDSFFCIGSTHDVCQDYALSSPDKRAVIVSDGCSSSPDTDFGARLLVKAKEQGITEDRFFTLGYVLPCVDGIGLKRDCLNATLLTAWHDPDQQEFRVEVYGDGVVVARKKGGACAGELMVLSLEYKSGAPYYLRYQLDEKLKESYFKEFGYTFQEVRRWVSVNGLRWPGIGNYYVAEREPFTEKPSPEHPWSRGFSCDHYDMVAVMSDGAHSFMRKNSTPTSISNAGVPCTDIVKEIFNFKNYNGNFVKRRCLKALKDFNANGIFHYDDFSIGVVYNDGVEI